VTAWFPNLNPTNFVQSVLNAFLWHIVVPIVLVFLAIGTLIFAPMKLRWKLLLIIIFLAAAAYLWGLIPGVG